MYSSFDLWTGILTGMMVFVRVTRDFGIASGSGIVFR
jgi:hypothetical protein